MTLRKVTILGALMLLSACDGSGNEDGGIDASAADAGQDGGGTVCARTADCDDGLYCNGSETCEPGSASAGPDGCVEGTPPCSEATCDEASDSCDCTTAADADDDGHDSMACGGDDCDDDDPNRYPGNEEVCDAEGHDEDCVDTTVGDRDEDSDGFVDAACCNGDVCGEDCDDDDVNVNPDASEACDGIDNDCDDTVDTSETSLCPGGLCTSGTCSFDAWDRSFGSPDLEGVEDVAIDSSGNVLVLGQFNGDVDFGGGDEPAPGSSSTNDDAFLASYRPDEGFNWVETFTQDYDNDVYAVSTDAADNVYITARRADFGGSPVYQFIARYDSDGVYQDHLGVPSVQFRSLDVIGGPALSDVRIAVRAYASSTVDLGDGDRGPGEIIAVYDGNFTLQWSVSAPVDELTLDETSGAVYAAAKCEGTVNVDGTDRDCGDDGLVVLSAESPGTVTSANVFDGDGLLRVKAIASSSTGVYVSFSVSGIGSGIRIDGDVLSGGATMATGFVLGLDATSLAYSWVQDFDGAIAEGVAVSSTGVVVGVGYFTGSLDVGCSARPFTDGSEMFIGRWSEASGSCVDDDVYRSTGVDSTVRATCVDIGVGDTVAIGGHFMGTVDLGDGDIVSAGAGGERSQDGFVMRFGL
ncbi:MAG TPA: MopE-related protein [Sandaracinaceae bacterium LLY-WYZ-13_1]|nr:MopE-related protein [Sandaracinaceae bacterium LLY-WYZ-13_1]